MEIDEMVFVLDFIYLIFIYDVCIERIIIGGGNAHTAESISAIVQSEGIISGLYLVVMVS